MAPTAKDRKIAPPAYTPLIRRNYIEQQLHGPYGYVDYEKGKKGWSYRRIASDVGLRFERPPPSGATIQNDIIAIREKFNESERQRNAGVLDPAHFRQWRAKFFTDPGTGLPYETPDHQYHWFRVMMALALKEDVPDETLEYLDLPSDLNGDIEGKRKMLTLILLAPPRHGKRLSHTTPVFTPDGWRTHGDLRVGDLVYAADGSETKITYVSPDGPVDMLVTFENGDEILTHDEHLWEVADRWGKIPKVKDTAAIAADLHEADGRPKWRVPLIEPSGSEPSDLPVDPYLFGLWLGDGSSYKAEFTTIDPEIEAAFAEKYELSYSYPAGRAVTRGVLGLVTTLGRMGVKGNKHIPLAYQTASVEQRKALLAGLMDSDGWCAKNGSQAAFSQKVGLLLEDFKTLVTGLGGTYTVRAKAGLYEEVFVRLAFNPFRLARKAERWVDKQPRNRILSIERVEPQAGKCIQVDHERHLYQVGRNRTLTHNTELAIHATIWLICYQPNIRILYCSGVLQTSRDNAALIKAELEFNEDLIEAYGPFRTDDTEWNQRQFTVATRTIRAKTSTVLSIGRGSNVLSKDADLIVVDDPQDLDAAESETTTARDFRWLTTQLMSRREPHTPVLGLGSHLPTLFGDLWTQVEQTLEDTKQVGQKVIIKKVKAHDYEKCDTLNDVDEDGRPAHTICVLWPSLRPYWFLEAQRSMIGDDVLFEAVYNQELLESALSYFPKEIVRGEFTYPEEADTGKGLYSDLDLKSIEPGILDTSRSWRTIPRCCNGGGTVLFGLGVDPGASDNKKASESAFVMAGVCSSCHRIYLVDFEHLRQSPELNPHTIIRFVESYSEISRVRIEINAYQKALARDPLIVQAQGKFRYLLEEWNTDDRKNDPMIGIPVLSRWMKLGKFSLPYRTEEDRETSEYFIRQLIRWPKRPNDLVMALWLCELSLAQMFEDSQYNVPEFGDGYERLPAYLKEQQVEIDMNDLVEY